MFGFSTEHARFLADEARQHGRVLTQEERTQHDIPGFVPYQSVFDQLVTTFRRAFPGADKGKDKPPTQRG
jgi:hypothetical protein